jgi:hypothetical protein
MSPRRFVPALVVLALALVLRPVHAQYVSPGPTAGGSCRPYVEELASARSVSLVSLALEVMVRRYQLGPIWSARPETLFRPVMRRARG